MTSFLIHRPVLRARLALTGRLATLLATSYFLIATSQPTEPEPPMHTDPPGVAGLYCTHPDLTISYHVTGSCGPAGSIVLISPVDECAISVQGAAELGLPSAGRFTSGINTLPANNAWSLAGYLPEGAATALPAADAGPFTVTNGPGTTPSGAPVPHDALVVRKCQARRGTAGELVLECKDASVSCAQSSNCGQTLNACTAVLTTP